MCDTCETAICLLFDELVRDYYIDFPPRLPHREPSSSRPKYVSTEFSGTARAAASEERFGEMVQAATGIGYESGEFMAELGRLSGYKEHVHNWARGKVPNGLIRKIILTRAEMMIRERGAQPTLTLRQAA